MDGLLALAPLERMGRYNPKQLDAQHFARAGVRVRATVDALPGDAPAVARLALGPEGAAMLVDARIA